MAIYKDVESLEVVAYKGESDDFDRGVTFILEKLDALPVADVAAVRHGKWLYVSGEGRYAEYECSECKAHVRFDEKIDGTIPRYKGCPHCLAVMDLKE